MPSDILTHWFFLAVVSSIATALLIVLSVEAFGGLHSSLIMVLRIIGVAIIVIPIAVYAFCKGNAGINKEVLNAGNLCLWGSIAACAGISWYTFYLALENGKIADVSSTTITAINYASVILIMLISWGMGRHAVDWKNWLGVAMVVAGIYFVELRPAPISATQSPQPNAEDQQSQR